MLPGDIAAGPGRSPLIIVEIAMVLLLVFIDALPAFPVERGAMLLFVPVVVLPVFLCGEVDPTPVPQDFVLIVLELVA